MSTLSLPTDGRRQLWRGALGWRFALFSSARILACLPTIGSIHASGNASMCLAVTAMIGWHRW